MLAGVKIEPETVYDDGSILFALDISFETLARARREGRLRFTRQGRRVLYLGQWILDWLAEPAPVSNKGAADDR
jgi:hypothetical protein